MKQTILCLLLTFFTFYASSLYAQECNISPQKIFEGQYVIDTPGALAVSPISPWLAIVDETAFDLKIVSTKDNTVYGTVALSDIEPADIVFSSNGAALYVSGAFSGNIAKIDTRHEDPNTWQASNWLVEGDFSTLQLTQDNSRLYVTDRKISGIKVLSTQDGSVLDTLTVENCRVPSDMVLDEASQKLYLACENSNELAIFDLNTHSLEKTIRVATSPVRLFLHPIASKLFIASANAGEGVIQIFNTEIQEVAKNLEYSDNEENSEKVLSFPIDMAFFKKMIWVLDKNNSYLVPLNPNQEALKEPTCTLGERPSHLAIASDSETLYISQRNNIEFTEIKSRFARVPPQVLMTGFDPPLIHKADKQVKIVAVIEQGLTELERVALTAGGGADIQMNFVGEMRLPLNAGNTVNALVYESVLALDPVTFPETCVLSGCSIAEILQLHPFSLFGELPGQFRLQAKGTGTETHFFPHWHYGEYPLVEADVARVKYDKYAKKGIPRGQPQVVMAGFTPAFMDITDEVMQVLAVVRPGSTDIRSVGLKTLDNVLFTKMELVTTFVNGDMLYSGTVIKRAEAASLFPSGYEFSNIWNDFFQVVVTDEASQTHRFPDVRIGDYPEISVQ